MKSIILLISAVVANISGWGFITLGAIDFLWLLVKGVTLFSWWWLVVAGIIFVISIVGMFVSMIYNF